jgi:uncharacterized protein (TIRG00374 family)
MTETERSPDSSAGVSALRRRLLVGIVLVVVIYAVGGVVVGGRDALDAVMRAAPLPLVGAVLLQALVTLTWPLVHRASLRAVGEDVSYGQALQVSMSAFTVSHTVPGGGAVGAAVAVERLSRFGIPGPAATASAALTGPVSLTTIIGLGAAGIAGAVVAGELPTAALGLAVLALLVSVALVAAIVVGLRSPELGERAIDLIGRSSERLRPRAEGWRSSWRTVTEHAPSAAATAPIFGWAVAKWTADIASLALVFVALGQTPRLTVLLVGFGVSQVLAAVPATPGSVGVVEGGMVGAFAVLGIPTSTAVTVTLLYRVAEAWLPTLAGIPVLLRGATPDAHASSD